MSVEAMALVLHHSEAKDTAKVVLLGIANHDGDGGAWPSVDTLARYARKDRRTIQRAIRWLEDAGELRVHTNQGGTHETRPDRRPNRYEILLACPPHCDGTSKHNPVVGVTQMTPRDAHGVTDPAERGDRSDPHGVSHVSPEPSLNHPEPSGRASAPRRRGTEIPDPFVVTADMRLWAQEHCPAIDWRLHTQRFVAHFKAATGQRALKRDWLQTWRKWLLKEQDDAATRRQPARAHL